VTRQRIVEAAAASLRKNGMARTGLCDLLAAAGLTHGRSWNAASAEFARKR
jgi:TetR/AcrR family transcriptional regulator, transcriptional repressor for nem operon